MANDLFVLTILCEQLNNGDKKDEERTERSRPVLLLLPLVAQHIEIETTQSREDKDTSNEQSL